jgi:serine/threonine-protein kinase
MGDVWIARNEATQAELAVKTLLRAERTALHDERFRREARLSATISHRNVVRVYDLVDEPDGTLGLVMELLRGATLEAAMKEKGVFNALQSVAVAIPVLSAMHHVHQKGIVHRDMKPGNVFFAVEPDGHVIPKVLDFGIAKLPAAGSALTIDGSVLGTPHYMSPEQIRGQEDIDGRSDMFSFAVVLYEMLTGIRIFHRETASASLAAVLEHEVDPDPRIEPRLWIALSRALAKRPYERYANCSEFLTALRGAVEATDEDLANALQDLRPRLDNTQTSTTAPSIAVTTALTGVPTTRPWLPVAVGGAIGACLVVLVLALWFRPSSGTSRTAPLDSSLPAIASAPVPPPPEPKPVETRAIPPEPKPPASTPPTIDLDPVPTTPGRPAPLRHPPGAPTDRKPKPKGVATTPGF